MRVDMREHRKRMKKCQRNLYDLIDLICVMIKK